MTKKHLRIALILLIAIIAGAFFAFDLGQYLSVEYLQQKQSDFQDYYNQNPTLTLGLYFIIYVIVTAVSLPGATILTLAGGALFGLKIGLLVVSFASTIGATLAFLSARFLFRESIQTRFADKLKTINDGIRKDGNFYLFALRLVPAFPFFLINIVMGLTPIKTLNFYWISQLGMLPGTAVYVNAGSRIASIESLKGILAFDLILSFALLGVFPIAAKKLLEFVKRKRSNEVTP